MLAYTKYGSLTNAFDSNLLQCLSAWMSRELRTPGQHPLKLLGLITLLIHSSCLNHTQETMGCGLSKPILAGKYNANMLNHFLNGWFIPADCTHRQKSHLNEGDMSGCNGVVGRREREDLISQSTIWPITFHTDSQEARWMHKRLRIGWIPVKTEQSLGN